MIRTESALQNEEFLSNEYVVGRDLLVAPITTEDESHRGWRTVYLPGPDTWFPSNLVIGKLGIALSPRLMGGNAMRVQARIQKDVENLSKVTPMYIREGQENPYSANLI